MKKIISLFVALGFVLCATHAYAITQPDFPGIKKSIIGGRQSEAVRVYKRVRYAMTNPLKYSISANEVVIYDMISDDGYTISKSGVSADTAIAGIAVTEIQSAPAGTITDGRDHEGKRNWGYIQVHGPCIAKVLYTSPTVGDPFITSADNSITTGASVTDRAVGSVGTFEADHVILAGTAGDSIFDLRQLAAVGGFFMDTPTAGVLTTDVFIMLE